MKVFNISWSVRRYSGETRRRLGQAGEKHLSVAHADHVALFMHSGSSLGRMQRLARMGERGRTGVQIGPIAQVAHIRQGLADSAVP